MFKILKLLPYTMNIKKKNNNVNGWILQLWKKSDGVKQVDRKLFIYLYFA